MSEQPDRKVLSFQPGRPGRTRVSTVPSTMSGQNRRELGALRTFLLRNRHTLGLVMHSWTFDQELGWGFHVSGVDPKTLTQTVVQKKTQLRSMRRSREDLDDRIQRLERELLIEASEGMKVDFDLQSIVEAICSHGQCYRKYPANINNAEEMATLDRRVAQFRELRNAWYGIVCVSTNIYNSSTEEKTLEVGITLGERAS